MIICLRWISILNKNWVCSRLREVFDSLTFYQRISSEGLSFLPILLMKKFWPIEARYLPTCGFCCFFFFKFFWCGPFSKSLLNLLQYCFYFMFWFFGQEACGILAPRPRIEPTPPALEGEVLTTGPPGKSQHVDSFHSLFPSCECRTTHLGRSEDDHLKGYMR